MNWLKFVKGFLGFAKAAAPVAAAVAKETGHEDVVDEINAAGNVANMIDRATEGATEEK